MFRNSCYLRQTDQSQQSNRFAHFQILQKAINAVYPGVASKYLLHVYIYFNLINTTHLVQVMSTQYK